MFDPPKRINTIVHQIAVTGCLMPYRDEQPVFVSMTGTDDLFIPLFTTVLKLRTTMQQIDIPYHSIKRIDHQAEFLASVPPHIRLIVDPYRTEQGTIRFSELQRD